MARSRGDDWEMCSHGACAGVRLEGRSECWAHAGETNRSKALDKLRDGGELDGRGVTFGAGLLARILAALPLDDAGHRMLRGARFNSARFERPVSFVHDAPHPTPSTHPVRFVGNADFSDTLFRDEARFADVRFDGDAIFRDATFEGPARCDEMTVGGDADFQHATFRRSAVFGGAHVEGVARFQRATFDGPARFGGVHASGRFDRATFRAEANFGGTNLAAATFTAARFEGNAHFDAATLAEARFDQATFEGEASFARARFDDDAVFDGASFHRPASFERATFDGDARFVRATFRDDVVLDDTSFNHSARFSRADFTGPQQLGPLRVGMILWLDNATFRDRATIKVSASDVTCRGSTFLAGVHLQVRWATVVLDDADLSAPSILERTRHVAGARDRPVLEDDDDRTVTPQLLSVQRANVAGLTLAGVDVHACRFQGAHHLDQLRLDECHFGNTPPVWWRTNRQVIAEEHHWRATHPATTGRGWYPSDYRPSIVWSGHEDPGPPTAAQVAAIYRELRKQREDSKDEPGAADFYYGEMEMRRHATGRHTRDERGGRRRPAVVGEHVILVLYWLLSGYGLRAWRALTSLAAVVLVAGVVLALWGFGSSGVQPVGVTAGGDPIYAHEDGPSGLDELPMGLRVSAQASTALLRGPDVKLTGAGEVVHISLRLLGPVLLGLAVLSIRGRVRR